MSSELRRAWTRGETILALELYYLLPPGADKSGNPQIQALAAVIGRTADSVKLKLQNFKSLDPNYTADGRTGLPGASKQDKALAAEFFGHWAKLLAKAEKYRQSYKLTEDYALLTGAAENFPDGADIIRSRKARIGQGFFRNAVLAAYDRRCCITGISLAPLLRASHIKPWAQANADEKLNPANGLLLNALFDAAFDQGYISLSADYRLLLSPQLRADTQTAAAFTPHEGKPIRLPSRFPPAAEFIKYHNDCVFRQ